MPPRKILPSATGDDDTEGHARRMPLATGDDDTEGHARRMPLATGEEDTEGHFMPNPLLSRELASARERDIRRDLKDRQKAGESQRLHNKRGRS